MTYIFALMDTRWCIYPFLHNLIQFHIHTQTHTHTHTYIYIYMKVYYKVICSERRNNRGHASMQRMIIKSVYIVFHFMLRKFQHPEVRNSDCVIISKSKWNFFQLFIFYVPVSLMGERTRDMTKWCQMDAHLKWSLYFPYPK